MLNPFHRLLKCTQYNPAAYQMPYENLRAILDGKLQWSVHGWVLHLGVDINMDAEQKKNCLHILLEYSKMEEILTPSIRLGGQGERERGRKIRFEALRELCVTCSAALGSLCSMARPVLWSRAERHAAKGVCPCLSLTARSREGWERRVSEQRVCMWEMATCSAVLPSESWRGGQGSRQHIQTYITRRLCTVKLDKR